MRVGILTHYKVNNQGAQLQLLSMKKYLERLGHDVYILSYEKDFSFDTDEAKKNSMSFAQFPYYIKEYLFRRGLGLTLHNTRKALTHKKALQNYRFLPYDTADVDCIVIGSDEVFSIDVGCNLMMYGHGLKVPAVAYAPSFGRSTEELLKEYNVYDKISEGLNKLYELSARDIHTQEMIKSMTGRRVPLVCDPVILYDGEYDQPKIRIIDKPYLLVYSYDSHMTETEEINEIKKYAEQHNLITISCGTYHKWCDLNIACNAEEWYAYFRNANAVITDTFHGAVVAMRNHCNLAVYFRKRINGFKLQSLLTETGLECRRLEQICLEEIERVLSCDIDYDMVDSRLAEMRTRSEEYLLKALDGVAR